jgi:hypothetical protein
LVTFIIGDEMGETRGSRTRLKFWSENLRRPGRLRAGKIKQSKGCYVGSNDPGYNSVEGCCGHGHENSSYTKITS